MAHPGFCFVMAIGLVTGTTPDDGAAYPDPDGFEYEAARLCTDIVNDTDAAIAEVARAANIEFLLAVSRNDEPDRETRDRWRDEVGAYRDVLVANRDRLAELTPDDAELAEAWAGIVDGGDELIDEYGRRYELHDMNGWEAMGASVNPGLGAEGEITGALESLRGRDCDGVFSRPGHDAAFDPFADAAASACTTIVSRRLADSYSTDVVLEAQVELLDGESFPVTPELTEQVSAIATEWSRTLDDLSAVTTEGAPDGDAWQATLDATEQRAEVWAGRVDALRSGDEAAIEERFALPTDYDDPTLGDLAANGLDVRDCGRIAS